MTTDFTGIKNQCYASAIQNDGKIILAGQAAQSSTKFSIALARYTMKVFPLKLLDFSATKEGKNNVLQWNTTQEINVARFEIERSTNGIDYTTIAKINTGSATYNYTDDKPFAGSNFYRLKMIDKDGKFEYSAVKIVTTSNDFYLNVYPLPAKERLNIQLQSNRAQKAVIIVTDVSGKKLIANTVALTAGLNNTSINVQRLGKGMYLLKIVVDGITESRQIIID